MWTLHFIFFFFFTSYKNEYEDEFNDLRIYTRSEMKEIFRILRIDVFVKRICDIQPEKNSFYL